MITFIYKKEIKTINIVAQKKTINIDTFNE